jgi:hypothetical protein
MKATPAGYFVAAWLAWLAFPCVARAADQPAAPAAAEPDYRLASQWWSELRRKWTPVGWKNHLFRFDVLFNGAIAAQPDLNRRTVQWSGQGMLLWPSAADPADYGPIPQGWSAGHDAPLLWTDWGLSQSSGTDAKRRPENGTVPFGRPGLRLRQEVFAHIPGGEDVKTGVEPLFAWVRLSIQCPEPKADLPKKHNFTWTIYAPTLDRSMFGAENLHYHWAPYPRKLSFQAAAPGRRPAILEPDGKVRLAVALQKGCTVAFHTPGKAPGLDLDFDVQQGNCVDLLVPMIPTPQDVVEKELLLGYEGALAQADAYWRQVPRTAAAIDVPEEQLTQAIRQYVKLAQVIAEKDPASGDYANLTGAWTYADVWSTPSAMTLAMLLDPMGYHPQAERYLAVFKKYQGSTVPPGKALRSHPGYLGTPKVYQQINWLSDNGALLWAFSEHALLSGDEAFTAAYAPAIVKSCEWIRDARASTGHGGIEGILPPAVATDEGQQVQSVWNDGWNYKGLTTAVRLLKRIKHPRAAEFEAEARQYRAKFRSALGEVARTTPTWTDAAGKVHPLAPRSLWGDKKFGINHAFYLDTGPLFLVFAGLMDADDELMRSSRAWFREGPPRKTYRDDGNCWQNPSLNHEMSSCEPAYSWVFFHSWQLGQRAKFLEGMYSLFAGASSRQTYTVCETRGGITGITPCLPNVWLLRLAVIDDQVREDELHLLRLAPLAWLGADKEARFENMPTEFGVVSLTAALSPDGRELRVTFTPKFRTAPKRLVLHVPPVEGLTAIRLNNQPLAWDGKQPAVEVKIGG